MCFFNSLFVWSLFCCCLFYRSACLLDLVVFLRSVCLLHLDLVVFTSSSLVVAFTRFSCFFFLLDVVVFTRFTCCYWIYLFSLDSVVFARSSCFY